MRNWLREPQSFGVLFEEYAAHSSITWSFDRPLEPWGIGPQGCSTARLAAAVGEASTWLVAAGVEPWDVVAIAKRNGYDYFLLACAAARIGAIPATLAPHHDPAVARELLARLDRPTLLADNETLRRWDQPDTPLQDVVGRIVALDPTEVAGAIPVTDLWGVAAVEARLRRPDEPMMITHTSGTTGVPKLVAHTPRTVMRYLARPEKVRWPVVGTHRSDSHAACVSWAHGRSSTWTIGTLVRAPHRVTVFGDPGLDVTTEVLRRARPTIVETHPNMYLHWEEMLDDDRRSLFADVRVFYNTFDAAHPRTVRAFLDASRRRLPVWIQGWGQSEAGPLSVGVYARWTFARRGDAGGKGRSVGRPIPGVARVRAVDPVTGRRVGHGERGLLMARTRGRCVAYVGEPRRHFEKIDGDWWNTGDVGTVSRLGFVRVFDREVDQLDDGSTLALEDVLLDRLEQAIEVIVLAVPDRDPLPVVCTKQDEPLSSTAWEAATVGLPVLQAPVQLKWDEVPRTSTWKVRRPLLRDQVLGSQDTVGTGRWT